MHRSVALKLLYIVVILSMVAGFLPGYVPVAQAAPEGANVSAPPAVTVPDPMDHVRAVLGDDPQAQALEVALDDLPGIDQEGPGANPPGLLSPLPELPCPTVPAPPEPTRPQLPAAIASILASPDSDADSQPGFIEVEPPISAEGDAPVVSPDTPDISPAVRNPESILPQRAQVAPSTLLVQNPPQGAQDPHVIFLPFIGRNFDDSVITPARGGIYTSPDGMLNLQFPPGAVAEPVTIAYTNHSGSEHGQRVLPGAFTIEAYTFNGTPISLDRPIVLNISYSTVAFQETPTLRWWDGKSAGWVAIGAYSRPAQSALALTPELPTEQIIVAAVTSLGTYALVPEDDEEDPDENKDGFVITRVCWEPEPDLEFTIFDIELYTTTEEADPWASMMVYWEKDNGDFEYDSYWWEERDFTYEPLVTITMETVGAYTVTEVFSYYIYADDIYSDTYRWDEEEGAFQVGSSGCVEGGGGCERIPPTIDNMDIWQSGTGFTLVTVAASDNGELSSVELLFNGQSYSMADMGDGTFTTRVDYPPYDLHKNSYQIKVTDSCGNYTTFPGNAIEAWPSVSDSLGDFCFAGRCDGWRNPVGDPVDSFSGNFTHNYVDATVAGLGETTLTLKRTYNSTASLWPSNSVMRYTDNGSGGANEEIAAGPPQYFGSGWTFPFGAYLLVIDRAPFYQGVQIHYADGHTVLFVSNGDGTYTAESPANFDTLTQEGDGFVLRHKRTLEVERFDADGKLVAIEDRNGNAITFTYDGNRLVRAENASGRWMDFAYTDDGLITIVSMPESVTLHYKYTDSLLTAFIDGRGKRTEYGYNAEGQLTEVRTPKGHPALRLAYDPEDGRTVEQIVGEAELRSFTYSEDGSSTLVTDAYGTQTVHHYDDLGRLVQVDYAGGTHEEYGYDDDFNRTYHRDQAGAEWHWTYDERGNRLTADGPLGWHREWDYNDLDLVTAVREKVDASTTRATTYGYDDHGNLTEICNPLSGINGVCSTIEYDSRGLPTDLWDFANNHTANSYDPEGDLVAVTNAEDETTEYDHDGLGRMTHMWTPLDYHYTYAYDPNDNLVAVDGPLGYHLGYGYDDNDNLEVEIDPNGGETRYAYDASENLVSVVNQLLVTTAAYTYGDMNEMASFTDGEERTWTYDYDALLRLTAIHGPLDTHTTFAYDAGGNVTGVTDPEEHVTHTEYDDLYRPTSVTLNYLDGGPVNADTNVTTSYAYDLVGNILSEMDPEENSTVYRYDLLDRLIYKRTAENQEWTYEYDPMGNVTQVVNPRLYPTNFIYDKVYRLYQIVDAQGNVTTFAYDDDGNLSDEIDPLGVVTHYDYDELDRLVAEVRNYRSGLPADAQTNVTTEYQYDPAGNLRFVTEPRDYVSEFRYDAAHRLTDSYDFEGGHAHYEYDRVDNLLSVTDDNLHATTYTYDDLDRRKTVANAEGHTVEFTYDKVGNVTDILDARGNPTHYDVDALGRTTHVEDALGGHWYYEYDRVGNVLVETDANGHPTIYTYDDVYRLRTATDAEGYVSAFLYDENDNLVEFVDGNTHSTGYTYDELDRLQTTTNAEGETTEYRYDPLGNQTHLIEADGTITLYGYDPLYRLNMVTENYVEGAPADNDTNVLTRYTYDASGYLDWIVNANEAVADFDHDGMGRQVQEVDPLGNTWTYTYDRVGNRLTRLDANGDLTGYAYYPDDQLCRIDYGKDGTSVEYTYDENNNRRTMVDSLGTTEWLYDALNRVTDVVDPFARALHFEYDRVGNRTEMVYPDGNVVAYGYYRNDWLKTMTDPTGRLTTYERDGVGNITRTLNPNSTVTTLTYDQANRVLTLRNEQVVGAMKTNSAFAYTYNQVGHVTQVVNEYGWRNPPVVTETYTYDGLHRLAGMEDSDGVVMAYAYDKVGNRLVWQTNDDLTTQTPFDGFDAGYDYNAANQLLTATVDSETPNGDVVIAFTYDGNGNRTGKLADYGNGPEYGTDYSYDPENRLVVAQDYQLVDHDNRVDRAVTTLAYDGGGRRLVKSYDPKADPAAATDGVILGVDKRVEYVFDGLDPVAEYDMLNGQRDNYYRGALGHITTMHHFKSGSQGQMYWYHYNFKGDVVGLTKHSGQSTHNYRYDPYGGVVPDNGTFTDPHNHYALTGQDWDESMRLYEFYSRDYDPVTGVWLSQDIYRGELRIVQSLYRYQYVFDNPVTLYDILGFLSCTLNNQSVTSYSDCFDNRAYFDIYQDYEDIDDKELEKLEDAIYDDLTMAGGADGSDIRNLLSYDTPFWNGYDNPDYKVCSAEHGHCDKRSEVNYLGIGMYAAHQRYSWGATVEMVYDWKKNAHGTTPSKAVMYWTQYGYYLYQNKYDPNVYNGLSCRADSEFNKKLEFKTQFALHVLVPMYAEVNGLGGARLRN